MPVCRLRSISAAGRNQPSRKMENTRRLQRRRGRVLSSGRGIKVRRGGESGICLDELRIIGAKIAAGGIGQAGPSPGKILEVLDIRGRVSLVVRWIRRLPGNTDVIRKISVIG